MTVWDQECKEGILLYKVKHNCCPSTSTTTKIRSRHVEIRPSTIGLTALLSLHILLSSLSGHAFIRAPNAHSRRKSPWLCMSLSTTAEPPPNHASRDVRFLSPLLDYGYRPAVEEFKNGTLSQKPILLYLPGFDGTFLSPFLQFPELHSVFDVRCMTVGSSDRSSFDEMRESVLDFLREEAHSIQDEQGVNQTIVSDDVKGSFFSSFRGWNAATEKVQQRDLYLVGESFGGVLACDVVSSILGSDAPTDFPILQGLTLINPATCYDRSRLAAEGPPLTELQPWLFPIVGLLRLLPLLTDEYSFKQLLLILQGKGLPSVIDNAEREAYMGRVAFSLPWVIPVLTQGTLLWRLKYWLETGCARIDLLLADETSPLRRDDSLRVLIVAGEMDATLPSIAEAERLASILPKDTLIHVVEGAGHASTCGSRIDLAAVMRGRFPELGRSGNVRTGIFSQSKKKSRGRTSMKEEASSGVGEYFGMEPRYDNQTVGLNPLTYWSKKYYLKYQPEIAGIKTQTDEPEESSA